MLLVCAAATLAGTRTGTAAVRRPAHGQTLQAVIDASQGGDIVEVPPGTWRERLVIRTPITLRGTGGVIDGEEHGTILEIDAPYVVVENVTLRNSGTDIIKQQACITMRATAQHALVRGNRLERCLFGIYVDRSHHSAIIDNVIGGRPDIREPDRGNGIELYDCERVRIIRNTVVGARDGIYVAATDDSVISFNRTEHQRYGIHYMYSFRNTLEGNHSSHNLGGIALMVSNDLRVVDNVTDDNERHGILFRDNQRCELTGNVARRNIDGLFVYGSLHNRIARNWIEGNEVGLRVWGGSRDNEISANAFVGNRHHVFYVGQEDLVVGIADPGNYWSEYIGWDQDADGVGDRPYRMDSMAVHLVHRYPAAIMLVHSPALELLSNLEDKLPILRVATIVDRAPLVASPRERPDE
ncbi:MAG: nitrous oxide reductase family maturation protein NosD [Proteobacteria bacterium]|nr:nitrous oxide reductase family maturation protein NosD [Pseudomonadota bacterium]